MTQSVLRFDPDAPIAQVSPEFGTAVHHVMGFVEDESRDGIDCCRKAAWPTPLIDSAASVDVCVGTIKMNAVCGGNPCTIGRVPWPGQDDAVRCSAALLAWRHSERWPLRPKATKSREESASAEYWVDLVISLALSWQSTPYCCCHDGLLIGSNDGPERKATHKGHHDVCYVSTCGFCERCDVPNVQMLETRVQEGGSGDERDRRFGVTGLGAEVVPVLSFQDDRDDSAIRIALARIMHGTKMVQAAALAHS